MEAAAESGAAEVPSLLQLEKVTGLISPAAIEKSVSGIMGESYKAVGEVIVPIKNESLKHFLNNLSEGHWVKIYEAGIKNGGEIEVHYFKNTTTGDVFDVKMKYDYFHQKEFKSIVK